MDLSFSLPNFWGAIECSTEAKEFKLQTGLPDFFCLLIFADKPKWLSWKNLLSTKRWSCLTCYFLSRSLSHSYSYSWPLQHDYDKRSLCARSLWSKDRNSASQILTRSILKRVHRQANTFSPTQNSIFAGWQEVFSPVWLKRTFIYLTLLCIHNGTWWSKSIWTTRVKLLQLSMSCKIAQEISEHSTSQNSSVWHFQCNLTSQILFYLQTYLFLQKNTVFLFVLCVRRDIHFDLSRFCCSNVQVLKRLPMFSRTFTLLNVEWTNTLVRLWLSRGTICFWPRRRSTCKLHKCRGDRHTAENFFVWATRTIGYNNGLNTGFKPEFTRREGNKMNAGQRRKGCLPFMLAKSTLRVLNGK